MTVNCLPSPVPVICIVAPPTSEPSEVSLPDKLTRKVPAEPTFPLFGNAPNDKDVDVLANTWLVVAASIDNVRIPATTMAAIPDIEIGFCTICCIKLLYIPNKWY